MNEAEEYSRRGKRPLPHRAFMRVINARIYSRRRRRRVRLLRIATHLFFSIYYIYIMCTTRTIIILTVIYYHCHAVYIYNISLYYKSRCLDKQIEIALSLSADISIYIHMYI